VRLVVSLLRLRDVEIHGIQQTQSVPEAVASFIDNRTCALAVHEDEQFTGIFTKNDLVRCIARYPDGVQTLKISEVMKKDLYTSKPDADLDDLMEVMVKRGFRHVPVLDAERVVGMVTSEDILSHQNEILQVERDELKRYIQGSY
jgi:CBS domain-containing protein